MANSVLSESRRRSPVFLWTLHWLAAAVVPQFAMMPLTGPLNIERSISAVDHVLYYGLLFSFAFGLGLAASLIDKQSIPIAGKAWVIPTSIFVFFMSWQLIYSNFNLRSAVGNFFFALPDEHWDEPSLGYELVTAPALTAVAYSLGSRFRQHRADTSRNIS
jgi:hypothetical protein